MNQRDRLLAEEETIEELLTDLTALTNRLSDKILGAQPIEIPETTEDIAVQYYWANETYNRVQNIFAAVRHNREVLKTAMVGVMEMQGSTTSKGPYGSKISVVSSIYARPSDLPTFIEWCRKNGHEELLETKARKGSSKNPGVDKLVSDIVKTARLQGGDILLPPGLEYYETRQLRVNKPSASEAFDVASMSVIERLKQGKE